MFLIYLFVAYAAGSVYASPDPLVSSPLSTTLKSTTLESTTLVFSGSQPTFSSFVTAEASDNPDFTKQPSTTGIVAPPQPPPPSPSTPSSHPSETKASSTVKSSEQTQKTTVLFVTNGKSVHSEHFLETSIGRFDNVPQPTTFTTKDSSGNLINGIAFPGGGVWLGVPVPPGDPLIDPTGLPNPTAKPTQPTKNSSKSTTKSSLSTTKSSPSTTKPSPSTTKSSPSTTSSQCSKTGNRKRVEPDCEDPPKACPTFDLPLAVEMPDDDEGTDPGSLLPGMDNPVEDGLKRSVSIAGRIGLGNERDLKDSTLYPRYILSRASNYSTLMNQRALSPVKPWNGPDECNLATKVSAGRYPKASELTTFAPAADFWYITSNGDGENCTPWTIEKHAVRNPATLRDARDLPYAFGAAHSDKTTPSALINSDHVYELQILKGFFNDDIEVNSGSGTKYCDDFKKFWDQENPASSNVQGQSIGANRVKFKGLFPGGQVSRMGTLFKLLPTGQVPDWTDMVGMDANVNNKKGQMFEKQLTELKGEKGDGNDTPQVQAKQWIDRLNLLGVAMDFLKVPEVQAIFQRTSSRIYGALQAVDSVENKCDTDPQWASKYSVYMTNFLSTQGASIQEYVTSVIRTNLQDEFLTTIMPDGSKITTLVDQRAAVTPKLEGFAFDQKAMLSFPAEPANGQAVIMKRDAATTGDACSLSIAPSTTNAGSTTAKASATPAPTSKSSSASKSKSSSAPKASTTSSKTSKTTSQSMSTTTESPAQSSGICVVQDGAQLGTWVCNCPAGQPGGWGGMYGNTVQPEDACSCDAQTKTCKVLHI